MKKLAKEKQEYVLPWLRRYFNIGVGVANISDKTHAKTIIGVKVGDTPSLKIKSWEVFQWKEKSL